MSPRETHLCEALLDSIENHLGNNNGHGDTAHRKWDGIIGERAKKKTAAFNWLMDEVSA
jgi:hypothetical protein